MTGDQRYRDYGWAIFQAIEKCCKIETGGYASVLNVDKVPVEYEDKMETFLMVRDVVLCKYPWRLTSTLIQSETLKYLYLLFEDDKVLPLSSEYIIPPRELHID